MGGVRDKGSFSVLAARYGGRLRLRVCGLAFMANRLLLLRHSGIGPKGAVWMPPGGGVRYGERASDALVREFKEETGLSVVVKEFIAVCEYIAKPLHACELFFRVEVVAGKLHPGYDPETPTHNPIDAAQWMSFASISQKPKEVLHDLIAQYQHQAAKLQNPLMFYSFAHDFHKK